MGSEERIAWPEQEVCMKVEWTDGRENKRTLHWAAAAAAVAACCRCRRRYYSYTVAFFEAPCVSKEIDLEMHPTLC